MAKNGFTSYRKDVERQMERKIDKALASVGLKADEIQAMEIETQPRFGDAAGFGAVDTGHMLSSVGHQIDRQNKQVITGNAAPYAIYVTMGTHKMPSRPFMQNMINNYADDFKAVVEDAMRD